ncbi:MAG TPA: hypothetical protein VGM88_21080 [Kofleriaceae bacterium]|jgi:hypothetical protein
MDKLADFMRAGGWNMWFLLLLGFWGLYVAARFARSADPHRLSLVRALSIAMIAAMVTGFGSNLIAVAHYFRNHPDEPIGPGLVQGIGESLSSLVLGSAFLTVFWLLVAVGVRRMPRDPS